MTKLYIHEGPGGHKLYMTEQGLHEFDKAMKEYARTHNMFGEKIVSEDEKNIQDINDSPYKYKLNIAKYKKLTEEKIRQIIEDVMCPDAPGTGFNVIEITFKDNWWK